jgi:CHASE2 domain-containing sensor protein
MRRRPKKIDEILIASGVLTKEQLKRGLQIQKKKNHELIGQILLKQGFVSEKDIVDAMVKQREYLYVAVETPAELRRNTILTIGISLFLAIISFSLPDNLAFVKNIDYQFYGGLLKTEYALEKPPSAVGDLLLVTIDNETLKNMPHRWPYPRSDFAAVIENLKKAQAKVIAFDFVFLGKSSEAEDTLLKNTINSDPRIILASGINEQGELDLYNNPALGNVTFGIVTKIQDRDEVIRRNLTYLVGQGNDKQNVAFLSWGMQILKVAKNIDLASLTARNATLTFRNYAGEQWMVPVDPQTKSYLIHFRAHTRDFPRISFYQVFKGDFDPRIVKDKIVMVGIASNLLQDLKYTSIGWMPGLTLNANAFLALYAHNFLKNMPKYAEHITLLIGIMLAAFFIAVLGFWWVAGLTCGEIFLFFVLSYLLLLRGYIWNYALFPLSLIIIPFIAQKILYSFKSK